MRFLSDGKRTIKADEKYESIYQVLSEKTGMTIPDIFFLCVMLGKRYNAKSENFKPGTKELRPSYFNEIQRGMLYAIADSVVPITEIDSSEKINEVFREYQLLSNGGMEILLSEVLGNNFSEGVLDSSYDGYSIDLMKFIYTKLDEVPF